MSEGNGSPQQPALVPGKGGIVPPVERRYGGPKANPGNPGGRPKGSSLLAPLLRRLAKNPNEDGEGAEAVATIERLLDKARNGKDITTELKLIERVDGSPNQKIEHSGRLTNITIEGHPTPQR